MHLPSHVCKPAKALGIFKSTLKRVSVQKGGDKHNI